MTPSFVELPNVILKSHETNDYHSSKVASVRVSCRRGTDPFLQRPFRACVRLSDALKKSLIPPEIPKKICHANLSMFSQLSLFLSNKILGFPRQITAAPRRDEGKYCRRSTSLIRSILGLVINHYSFWIYSRRGNKTKMLDYLHQSYRTRATDNSDLNSNVAGDVPIPFFPLRYRFQYSKLVAIPHQLIKITTTLKRKV